MANVPTAKPAFTADTQYHSLSSISDTEQQPGKDSSFLEPKLELGDHPPLQKSRSWLKTILLQSLCLLWTAPIMALLVLNFKRHIIGASAWCPNDNCWVQGFSVNTSTTVTRITKFDRQDHNLLGALQFVAKALEIWFELIATALVYLVTMLLASKKDGLPIGYLTRPNEFADATGLFDRLLRTSLPIGRHNEPYKRCANPPSISSLAPTAMNDTFGSCLDSDFAAYNYTCASYDWAEKLDAWVSSFVTAAAESSYRTITWQDVLSFTVNTTSSRSKIKGETVLNNDPMTWIPNRNLIKAFYKDAAIVAYISQGYSNTEIATASWINDVVPVEITDREYETYRLYNKSLELELQRSGPILGTYPNWMMLPRRSGWGPNTKYTNFSIEGVFNNESQQVESGIKYEVYSSGKVAFLLNGQPPSSFPEECLARGQISKDLDCDWDALFAEPGPSPRIKNNVTTLVMTMTAANNVTAVLATQAVPQIGEPVALNPAWTLAAWSTEFGGRIPAEQATASILRSVMTSIAENTTSTESKYLGRLLAIVNIPVFQTLSMIEYEVLLPFTSSPSSSSSSRQQLLTRNANLHVWAYGLTSRTALLGAVVSISGLIVVCFQFCLGLVDRKDYRSPTQLLVAALEHFPRGEVERVLASGNGGGGGCADEREVARTRFCVREVERGGGVGRLGFRGLGGRV
ncbi:hypothetical protein KC340_g11738 [Hortaea werneckii]|nr:hypothetical protein KC342_g12025 [Hortaea werneckii]KAI7080565.1 hypothetical protein KC339_g13503 [Hortaea werneckii]KAI7227505.1 hypothetical protein KC365_g8870 [Hortaea werneckii]KAI7306368.1 hypothetical protein KC340_g11738 [Hortaea werneckii]KAI7391827.1 hypothetical protein KC328_g7315 [Hortaea werneckii]